MPAHRLHPTNSSRGWFFALGACLLVAVHFGLAAVMQPAAGARWHATGIAAIDAFGQWDAVWYTGIAEHGYTFSLENAPAWAFFPGFPLLINGLTTLTGLPYGVSGSVIATGFGVGSVLLLRALSQKLANGQVSDYATLAFIAYPYSMFLFGPAYTEAVALALTLAAFLLLESHHLVLAGLAAGAATSSRPIALAVVLGLSVRAWEISRSQGQDRSQAARSGALVGILSATGQLAYMAYSAIRVQDPLAFLHAQSDPSWSGDATVAERILKVPYFTTLHDMLGAGGGGGAALVVLVLMAAGLGCFLAFACLTWWVPRLLPRSYLLFALACFVPLVVGAGTFASAGRFMLLVFPVFIVIGHLLARAPRGVPAGLLGAAVLVQVGLAVAFTKGYFVA